MKTFLILSALIISLSQSLFSRDWIDTVSAKDAKIVFTKGFPKFDPEEWIRRGNINFINLSFWDTRGPVGSLIVNGEEKGRRYKYWPVISMDSMPHLATSSEKVMNGFSGSNLLVREGKVSRIPKNFFAKRNCPRTAVGILANGDLVIVVSERSTLKSLAQKMLDLGSTVAINLDGGGSSLFVKDGEILWPQGDKRGVPVILCWKRK